MVSAYRQLFLNSKALIEGGQVSTTAIVLISALLAVAAPALGDTSNYVKQAISTNFSEHEGLPTQGVLNGTVTELDDISHRIVLNKTDAALNCSSGNFV